MLSSHVPQDAPLISIVVPVYNEEKQIATAIERIEAFMKLKDLSWELIVSSDGSIDKTDEIVRSRMEDGQHEWLRLLTSSKNQGKGAAAKRGVLGARGEFILITDVDLSAPIKEMDKLIAVLGQGYDAAIGSRGVRIRGCDVQQSYRRWFSGRIFNKLVKILVIKDYEDTQCGFKCFKKNAARELFQAQTLVGFGFDVEILYLAKTRHFKVKEVPVMWREGRHSKIRLFKDSVAMFKELLHIRKYYSIR